MGDEGGGKRGAKGREVGVRGGREAGIGDPPVHPRV